MGKNIGQGMRKLSGYVASLALCVGIVFVASQVFSVNANESDFSHARSIEDSEPESAGEIYQALISEGHIEAKVRLASLILVQGLTVGDTEDDTDYAIELLRDAASAGSKNALYGLGMAYQTGTGVGKDYERAREYYLEAAEQDEPRAMFRLGHIYLSGRGVNVDEEEAVYWYRKAAELDDVVGIYNMAEAYLWGWGSLEVDVDKAVEFLERGIALNDTDAMVSLGTVLYDDQFGREDQEKAFELFLQSANDGNAHGMHNVAESYRLGIGVESSYDKAYQWFGKAAEAGHNNAKYQLAVMYAKGHGVSRDTEKAKELLGTLAAQGDEDAAHALRFLESQEE